MMDATSADGQYFFFLPNSGSVMITSLQNIIKNEGFKGLHRGLSPTIIALLPNWAVYFTVYEQLKGLLHSHEDTSGQLTIGANMGAATAIKTNPLWVVKTRLQTQGMRVDVVRTEVYFLLWEGSHVKKAYEGCIVEFNRHWLI
ncbi:hypothetical protein SLA2020_311220 [Shorea laevis]